MRTPFVHIISTPLNHYIYDVNTNSFIKIPQYIFLDFKEYIESGIKTDKISDFVKKLNSRGYLSSFRPIEMKHSESDLIEYHLGENIEQMTLQVTQQCNFRCSYCVYAPKDIEYQRQHTSKHLSVDLAIKAVDFYASHSIKQDRVCIGFYGGEPLLRFDLIKKVVEYAEEVFDGKDLFFTITTNGSLFTEEIAEFLIHHNFSVLVSLDGTEEIHDRSRKFASTGKGTYRTIEQNLQRINRDFPKLYKKISYNIVMDPRYSCKNLHDMFTFNPLFVDANVSATIVNDDMSMEHVVMSDKYINETNIYLFRAYMAMLKKYPIERVSKIARMILATTKERMDKAMTPYKRLPFVMSHSGPCVPGQRRLFVDVDGNLFPCERVSETSPFNRIGSLNKGFDFDAARKLLNIVQLTPEECRNCWAILHCTQCSRVCDNNGELSRDLKLYNCNMTRDSVSESLKNYLMFKELEDDN